MLRLDARVFVAAQPVDFRGSFERLAGYVREGLKEDPRSGAFYVFMNRAGNRLKILFFDKTGDCILYKRLEIGSFRGLIAFDESSSRVEIDAAQLQKLLAGWVPAPRNKLH